MMTNPLYNDKIPFCKCTNELLRETLVEWARNSKMKEDVSFSNKYFNGLNDFFWLNDSHNNGFGFSSRPCDMNYIEVSIDEMMEFLFRKNKSTKAREFTLIFEQIPYRLREPIAKEVLKILNENGFHSDGFTYWDSMSCIVVSEDGIRGANINVRSHPIYDVIKDWDIWTKK